MGPFTFLSTNAIPQALGWGSYPPDFDRTRTRSEDDPAAPSFVARLEVAAVGARV
jgi:hypothetical protein